MRKYRAIFLAIFLMIAIGCAYDKGVIPKEQCPQKKRFCQGESVKPIGGGWVEAVGKASYANITPEEARRKAIINACIKAIQYSGFEYLRETLMCRWKQPPGNPKRFSFIDQLDDKWGDLGQGDRRREGGQ